MQHLPRTRLLLKQVVEISTVGFNVKSFIAQHRDSVSVSRPLRRLLEGETPLIESRRANIGYADLSAPETLVGTMRPTTAFWHIAVLVERELKELDHPLLLREGQRNVFHAVFRHATHLYSEYAQLHARLVIVEQRGRRIRLRCLRPGEMVWPAGTRVFESLNEITEP